MLVRNVLKILGILSLASWLSPPVLAQPLSGGLLVEGDFQVRAPVSDGSLKVVSFNLHGPPAGRIEDVYQVLQEDPRLKDADLLLLQEVNRDHAGSGNRDIGMELARLLQMQYVYAVEIEHGQGGGVRGLAILSRYPMRETRRIQLPVEGPGGRRRIAVGTTLEVGSTKLRFYNLHLETRISSQQRAEQIRGILHDAEQFGQLPTAIVGDFNTITSAAIRKMQEVMETAGFLSALPGNQVTFQRAFLVRMVLDWIWLKNLSVRQAEVLPDVRVSDHRPLVFTVSLE